MAGAHPDTVHATAIALATEGDVCAALIVGPSGAGKSDLALRCLGLGRSPLLPAPVRLLSDDRVAVAVTPEGALLARCPEAILGKLEVRGVGLVDVPVELRVAEARVVLMVDVSPGPPPDRYPLDPVFADIVGVPVPLLRLQPFEASAPHKVLLALQRAATGRLHDG